MNFTSNMELNLMLNLSFKKIIHPLTKYFTFGALAITLSSTAFSSPSLSSLSTQNRVNYRTFFGACPSRTAGTLTMDLVRVFEESRSLRDVKKHILDERIDEKYFITDYQIDYDPYERLLYFRFDCPVPLMKVQIYKNAGLESYEAILVENGQLFDPTYEVLLRAEDKISGDLPYLAIPVGDFDSELQHTIAYLIRSMEPRFRQYLAEVILNEDNELTIIMSVNGQPSSVFMGDNLWGDKVTKLQRIIGFLGDQDRVPSIINLTNTEKVVVKFNDRQ